MKLKGKSLDHWGKGLSARYDSASDDPSWQDQITRQIEHLESLPDAAFNGLPDWLVKEAVDAHTGYGSFDDFKRLIASLLPRPVPVPDCSCRVFPCLYYYSRVLPCLAIRHPSEGMKLGYQDAIEEVSEPADERGPLTDRMGGYASSWWRQKYEGRKVGYPLLQAGWWSEGKFWLLQPFISGGAANKLSQDFPPFFLPNNRPGWLRIRIVNWAVATNDYQAGEWGNPLYIDKLHLNDRVFDAMWSGSGEPDVPITTAGIDQWDDVPNEDMPVLAESNWVPPKPPVTDAPKLTPISESTLKYAKSLQRRQKSAHGKKRWAEIIGRVGQ